MKKSRKISEALAFEEQKLRFRAMIPNKNLIRLVEPEFEKLDHRRREAVLRCMAAGDDAVGACSFIAHVPENLLDDAEVALVNKLRKGAKFAPTLEDRFGREELSEGFKSEKGAKKEKLSRCSCGRQLYMSGNCSACDAPPSDCGCYPVTEE